MMKQDKEKFGHRYLTFCIPAGFVLGTVIAVLASLNIGMGAGIGLLIGVVAGTTIDYGIKKQRQGK